jgi:hypothetical protein
MKPRTITKEVFCHIFSTDGIKPISYATFFDYYVKPHLKELGITEQAYKSYRRGIPYNLSWSLIRLHKVTEEELEVALKSCQKHREVYKRALKRNI